jgi:hypothetical protein
MFEYLLAAPYTPSWTAMESVKEQGAFTAIERLFKERGLPHAIRSDNGVPFASPNGLFNLSAWPFGGSGSASLSSVSILAIRNRTVAMNACIEP